MTLHFFVFCRYNEKGLAICYTVPNVFAVKMIRVIGLSPCQPDHAFKSSLPRLKLVITIQILWPSTSLWTLRDPVTKELRNHFNDELRSLDMFNRFICKNLYMYIYHTLVKYEANESWSQFPVIYFIQSRSQDFFIFFTSFQFQFQFQFNSISIYSFLPHMQ